MREDHTNDFMQYVSTPPRQIKAKYDMYKPVMSGMRIISNGDSSVGLGEVSLTESGGASRDWMPVVIIVVSAMALLTVYAVVTKR